MCHTTTIDAGVRAELSALLVLIIGDACFWYTRSDLHIFQRVNQTQNAKAKYTDSTFVIVSQFWGCDFPSFCVRKGARRFRM